MRKVVAIGLGILLGTAEVSVGDLQRGGAPFLVNYGAKEYGAHDRNAAVVCDRQGNVYFANFEGLLCYDGQAWELLTTPGISRLTSLFIDSEGEVCAGGFNVAGRLKRDEWNRPVFQAYLNDAEKEVKRIGEVRNILEYKGQKVFVAEYGFVWVEGDSVRVEMTGKKLSAGFVVSGRLVIRSEQGDWREWKNGGWGNWTDRLPQDLPGTTMRELPGRGWLVGTDNGLFFRAKGKSVWTRVEGIPRDASVTDMAVTTDSVTVVATATYGVFFLNRELEVCGSADEGNGLCSNVVNGLGPDGKGSLWLATGKGIARMSVSSMYTRFTEGEGLTGEVLTIGKEGKDLYVGTYRGLFRLSQRTGRFVRLRKIKQACWQLKTDARGCLWAATGNGLFEVKNREVVKCHSYFTMSVAGSRNGNDLYSGEQDAVYVNRKGESGEYSRREVFADIGRVNELLVDKGGKVWMSTIFGEVYCQGAEGGKNVLLKGLKNQLGNRIVLLEGRVKVMSQDGIYEEVGRDSVRKLEEKTDFLPVNDWVGCCLKDSEGRIWLTRGDGKGIRVEGVRKDAAEYRRRLKAVEKYNIGVVYTENGIAWLGGSFGLIRLGLKKKDPTFDQEPLVYLRKVVRETGHDRNIRFTFASDVPGMVNAVAYSFRLLGLEEEWSEWSEKGEKEYARLPYGKYCFEVRARDAFGKVSPVESHSFRVPAPFYWKWYAWGVYAGILLLLAGIVMKRRTRRLREANQRLERVVEKRTQEIRSQRDEIARKSRQLEQTLEQLNKAQDDLIRQEKMATVGKLTQGLVDRILNPLNYIGNFAVLARGLAAEAGKVMEAEKERVPEELRMDMKEILEMLSGNLTKIAEHGESTARILKAMEEILKERKCMPVSVRMNDLCGSCMQKLKEWFAREVEEKKIGMVWERSPEEIVAAVDERQFEKVLMSVLGNGMYGLLKKWEKGAFAAELKMTLEVEGEELRVVIRDNGIGIEEGVLEKVFDPFFTTRSTAEAAGVGLYLCREVVLNHKGHISIRSQPGVGTEVTIGLKRIQGDGLFAS